MNWTIQTRTRLNRSRTAAGHRRRARAWRAGPGSGRPPGRRLRRAIALLGVLAFAGHEVSWAAAAPAPAAAQDRSASERRRGLHYGGLRTRGEGGRCQRFELALRAGPPGCTHGPDPAPDGVNVEQPAPIPSVSRQEAAVAAAALPCQGDGTSGPRVQLVYARAIGVADRYGSLAGNFQLWAAQVDDVINQSAAETGGVRRVRYVHDASCTPTVLRVQLTNAGDDNLTNTINELRAQGYNRSDRKYLVWVDANVYCGIAQYYEDDRPTADNPNNGRADIPGMVARVDTPCWGQANSVEAHELVHGLGAVQRVAPNSTTYGHCTEEYDRMCYSDAAGVTMRVVCGSSSHENRLDCNDNDYFSTAPAPGSWLATHWNTASSAFLSAASGSPATTTTSTTRPPATTTTTRAPTTTTTTRPATTTTRAPTTTTTTRPATSTTTVPRTPVRPTGIYRPTTGEWFLRTPSESYAAYGAANDVPVAGDYDGDGQPDIAVYRPGTGEWFLRTASPTHVPFGAPGDMPVPGDYSGDGTTDVGVYRPSTGEWFLRTPVPTYVNWGTEGDVPVPGDYDGNGATDVAVYRPATGEWFVQTPAPRLVNWGVPGDIPVSADYDGDRITDVGVYRPGTGEWFLLTPARVYAVWGTPGDIPVPSDHDGNGTAEVAVYRPATGEWFIHGPAPRVVRWGGLGDMPLPLTSAIRAFFT